MKLWLYLKLQGYFGYENDRTHVIKVVVLVVKITIQLTYDIHGFKKKEHTTTRLFNGDASTCRKQIFRSSHAFYTRKSTQSYKKSFNYQNYMTKITMKQMPCIREVGP